MEWGRNRVLEGRRERRARETPNLAGQGNKGTAASAGVPHERKGRKGSRLELHAWGGRKRERGKRGVPKGKTCSKNRARRMVWRRSSYPQPPPPHTHSPQRGTKPGGRAVRERERGAGEEGSDARSMILYFKDSFEDHIRCRFNTFTLHVKQMASPLFGGGKAQWKPSVARLHVR